MEAKGGEETWLAVPFEDDETLEIHKNVLFLPLGLHGRANKLGEQKRVTKEQSLCSKQKLVEEVNP